MSKAKILGANYGAMVVLPFANASIEPPAFEIGETIDTSVSDLLLRPLDLGWHTTRADVTAGLQLCRADGQVRARRQRQHRERHVDVRAVRRDDGVFDEKRTVSLAATAYWELRGKKEDTDVRVGQILTLQGGFAKSFLGGGLITGAAYYAEWKITDDQLAEFELPPRISRST